MGWYRWPGWYLTGVVRVLGILVLVDVVMGPTLTLIVASPGKARRALRRDIGIIIALQLVALVYGSITLWIGRPLYYTFSFDRLETVQASDLSADEIALARQQNPPFAPHWYSRPRWVWAALPPDPEAANKIVTASIFGGTDVIDMPRYFKPWEAGLPKLRDQLKQLDQIKYLGGAEKASLRTRIRRLGLQPDERNAIIMWGVSTRLLAVFDLKTLRIAAILKVT